MRHINTRCLQELTGDLPPRHATTTTIRDPLLCGAGPAEAFVGQLVEWCLVHVDDPTITTTGCQEVWQG